MLLRGRDTDDVKDWVVERLADWSTSSKMDSGGEHYTLDEIATAIVEGTILDKTQADMLESYLRSDITDKVKSLAMHNPAYTNYMSTIDDLSIYQDAYLMFCRPGTYTIS